ncbi:hypothetical protein OKW41_008490 [Paraburkholderia sp. UCT70]|uniref:hypothetical protein n=1 Tax=Paraburkholderia sp. UCT70 TaxID=2991068 RepID=UPI003D19308F
MRPVRIPPGSSPPQDWLDEAETLTEQLRNAPDDKARIALAFAHRKLWRDPRLLNWLTDIHHRKCWYSEAKESVSSYHVDHFRPKGRAAQLDGTQRSGYWWLTFDWKNYRLAGQLLNVKKRDLFPVQIPGVARPTVLPTLLAEGSLLIDPLANEAWFVSFERFDDGECIATPSPGLSQQNEDRVELTIDVLGLNRLRLLNKNRAETWDKCLERIKEFEDADSHALLQTQEALRLVAARALAQLCSEDQEFSSAAKACVEKQAPKALCLLVSDLLAHPELLKFAA